MLDAPLIEVPEADRACARTLRDEMPAKTIHKTKHILSLKYSSNSPYFCALEFYVRTNISYRIMRTTWNRVG
jgi:hypothetical protein